MTNRPRLVFRILKKYHKDKRGTEMLNSPKNRPSMAKYVQFQHAADFKRPGKIAHKLGVDELRIVFLEKNKGALYK